MNNKYINLIVYILMLTIYNMPDAISNTILVPQDEPSIQTAIDSSVDGDIVLLADGEYSISETIDFKGKAITVMSEYTPYSCMVKCNNNSCFTFDDGEGNRSQLMNITIMDAQINGNGGAINCLNSSPTIKSCIIKNNAANLGAAIYCENSSPVILASQIINNNAADSGGAIYIDSGSFPVINTCIIAENTAQNNGGGLYFDFSSSIRISQCYIYKNTAFNGGGIYMKSTRNQVISRSLIMANIATNNGGGIFFDSTVSSKIINCIINKNSSNNHGFALYFDSSNNSKIINCTLNNNETFNNPPGGVVYANNTSPTIINSILMDYNYQEIVYDNNSSPNVMYSYVRMNTGVYAGKNNINGKLSFVTTDDQDLNIPGNYYTLEKGSICIDTGASNKDIENFEDIEDIDFHGDIRSQQGNKFDIGATEYINIKGLEIDASSVSGNAPLFVEFICLIGESKDYSYTMYFGDGSEPEVNKTGKFKHTYYGGIYSVYCKVMPKNDPAAFSISDPFIIYVAFPKWKFKTNGEITSSPAIGADGTIYVGSEDGFLYAITNKGELRWKYRTNGPITGSPALYFIGNDEIVFVGSEDKNLYAIESLTGNKRWSFKTNGYIYSSPSIDQNSNIYIGSCDHNIYAINPDGTMKWAFYTGGMVISSPVYAYYPERNERVLYAGSLDNNFYAINATNGRKMWSFNTEGEVYSSPAISSDGTIYIGACNPVGAYKENKFFALDRVGNKKWEYEMGRGTYSSPTIFFGKEGGLDSGTVYVGSMDNHLYALNLDGTKKWIFPTRYDSYVNSYNINSTAAIGDDGTVYFGSYDNNIYALNPEKGNVLWFQETGGDVSSSPTIAQDGTLYVGSKDTYLYAIQTNSYGLSVESPWPMFKKDVKHTSYSKYSKYDMIPTILKTIPTSNAKDIRANEKTEVSIYFSKIMDPSKIVISFEKEGEEKPILSFIHHQNIDSTDLTIATFTPITPLEYDSTYNVYISQQANDLQGNFLRGQWTFSFSTETENPEGESDGGVRGCFISSMEWKSQIEIIYNYINSIFKKY